MEQSANQPVPATYNDQYNSSSSLDVLPAPAASPTYPRYSGWALRLWQRFRADLLIIGLYTVFALLFTWPLILHLTEKNLVHYPYIIDHLNDRDQNLWNIWWFKKALLELHTNPFETNYLYYPYGTSLYLHTLGPFNAVLALPFYSWLGLIASYNIVSLIIMVWGGYSLYLLADYLVRDKRAAFVAGFFFTFAPQHLFNLMHSEFNVITLQFLVLYILNLLKLDREGFEPRRRWLRYTLFGALWLALCSISDQYLLLYCLVITALYYLWRVVASRKWREIGGMLARTLPAQVLAGVLLSPYLWATWQAINSGKFEKVENGAAPSDLVALFLPPVQNVFVGAEGSELGRNFFIQPDPRAMSIGLVGMIVAILGIIRERKARWWGLLLLISVVLALGSYPSLKGQALDITLPGAWLNELPIFKVMRYSKRWLGPASLAIAVCTAYFVAGVLPRFKGKGGNLKRWVLVLGLLLIFTLEVEPWPIPLSGADYDLPRAYADNVLAKTDSRALLELPLREKYNIKAREMYFQTAHERPILGAYLSRRYNLNYSASPLAYFVDGYKPESPDFVTVKPEQVRGVLSYYSFGYVAVYKFELDPTEVETWRKVLEQVTGGKQNLVYEDSEMLLYRLPDFKDNPETRETVLMRGTGWGGLEKNGAGLYYRWISEANATLPIFAPPQLKPAIYRLEFQAASYYRDRTVQVRLKDKLLTTLKVTPALDRFAVEVDGNLLKEGDNLVTFDPIEPPDKPSEREGSEDTRALTVLIGGISWTKRG